MSNDATPSESLPSLALSRPITPWRAGLIGLLYALALAPFCLTPRHSGNVWSRYMAIESIVERGTQAIDASPLRAMSGSPDIIRSRGHFYSDKPPVLAALGALVYAPLYLAGLSFSTSPSQFILINAILTWTFAALGSALAVVAVRLLLQFVPLNAWLADLLALACGLTTLLLSYALTFNNHAPAAGLITLALALIALHPSPSPRRLFCAGLCAALAATLDLPAGGIITATLCAWLATRSRRIPVAFLAGCIPPLFLHALLQFQITGSPLPAELTPSVFEFEGSYWLTPEGQWRETAPRWRFGLELLLGPQGWLTVTPTLWAGLIAMIFLAARKRDPLGHLARATLAVTLALIAYYTWGVRRTDFAGQSFGTRHLLAITPTVYALGVIGLSRVRRPLRPLLGILFAVALGLSATYALAGARNPWTRIESRNDHGLSWVKPLTIAPQSSYNR